MKSLHFDDDGNFSLFNKHSNRIIVYFKDIKAPCPNSAARDAYNRLDIFFSFYKFVGNKKGLSIQKKAMVKEQDLHSYLDSTANEFIVKLAGDIPFSSREDVITDVKFAIANLDSILEKDVPINEKIIDVLIHPEIGYIMNCEDHLRT